MINRLTEKTHFDKNLINVILVGCLIVSFVSGSKDLLTFFMNASVLIIMYLFLKKGIGGHGDNSPGLYSLKKMTRDLQLSTEKMRELNSHDFEQIKNSLFTENDEELSSTAFKNALKEFYDESDALVRRGKTYYNCNIADYINDNLLNSVGNTSYNEFISSVMTGLGILGTFIGLAIGLQSFNTETAEAMTNSIAPLIEGIKVAFYTSIFGVLLSLVYGTLFKFRFGQAESALEEFISIFYRYNGYRPENEALSRLLQYQEEQKDNMNQFAEEISVALADAIEQSITPTLSQMPIQMTGVIQESIMPALQSLVETFNGVSREVTQNLTNAQNTGVESLVNNFLEQMDKAVGGQMENLEKSIQSICDWEQTTSEKLEKVVDDVCKNSENITRINDELGNMLMKMESYISNVEKTNGELTDSIISISDKLNDSMSNVESLIEKTENVTSEYEKMLQATNDLTAQIASHQQDTMKFIETYSEYISESSDVLTSQGEFLKDSCSSLSNQFNAASEKLLAVSDQLSNDIGGAMTRTYAQFDSQLATAITHFSGTLSELRDITENTPKIIDGASTKMENEVRDYLIEIDKRNKEGLELIGKANTDLKEEIHRLSITLNTTLAKLKETLNSTAE